MNAPEGKVGRLLDHLAWVAARVQGLAPGAVRWRDPVALESAGGGAGSAQALHRDVRADGMEGGSGADSRRPAEPHAVPLAALVPASPGGALLRVCPGSYPRW